MNIKNTLLKDKNLIAFCGLFFLLLIPFFIFVGKKHIAEVLADFAYGFLVLGLILGIRELVKEKNISKKGIKVLNNFLILFILIVIIILSIRFFNERNEVKFYDKRVSDALTYLEKGESFLNNQDYDNAIREFKQAIETNDRNFKSYYLVGRAYYKKGNYENAKDYLLKAIGLNKYDFSSNVLLAVVFENLGEYNKAIFQYENAKDLKPGDFGVHYGLGRTFYKVGNIYKSLNELLIANEKNPGNFEINFILGKIYYDKGDFQNSLKYFEFCKTIDSEDKKVKDYIDYLKEYD